MPNGYAGKNLFVNLSTGEIRTETPDDSLYQDFIGSYGIGARILYSHMRPGVDPLGPENMLGLVTGVLTGTPATMGCRFQAVGKSPLNGGWGDANAGGHFGPRLKFSGYDNVFFTGISEKPVYLFIDSGKAELLDADDLWGTDVYETEATLRSRHGGSTRVACIGPSGEKQAMIACIINENGAAAGRSGLGAVMGSKKLKAVAVRGEMEIPIADRDRVLKVRQEHLDAMRSAKMGDDSFWEAFHKYGTSFGTAKIALNGDTPIKNFGGIGIVDYPDPGTVSKDGAIANQVRDETCWQCPLACEGILGAGTGKYKYEAGSRRPEYETQAAFGGYLLNNDGEVVAKANDICNRAGLDTISAGTAIGFAIECFENGILNLEDTDGIELRWGSGPAIIAMTEKMANREGFGDVLADGVKKAAERIGRGSEEFSVHIGGQELGMHDPKFQSELEYAAGARYQVDATPGRHTQSFGLRALKGHIVNSSGLCSFGYFVGEPEKTIADFISAVTGWERSWDELCVCAQRIMAMRQAFNSREGINQRRDWPVHPRILGNPPQSEGPLEGVTIDQDEQVEFHMKDLGWDPETSKPTKEKLLELGLDDVARDLWP
jgi:aldehyde:ferredoxin oxidoreductase